jgi:DNA-binding CsgD family transcriptional regulator
MAVVQEHVRNDVVSLAHRSLGVRDFSLAAARALRRAVPFDGVCVLTIDPATLLPTGHVIENGLPDAVLPRYAEIEIREPDFNKFTALARKPQPAASLSEATGGQLDRSRRHRELRRPNGFGGDELRAAFVSDSGTWGGMVLLRESRSTDFTQADTELLASLARHLAEGLRRAVLLATLTTDGQVPEEGAPGLVLLRDDNTIESANSAAETWLSELAVNGHLPFPVQAVADRARSIALGDGDGDAIARARVRTPAGRWLVLRGSMLGGRAAVILEPARAPELARLIVHAYGLTARERAVTELVAQGLPTSEIAGRLYLSPYTVQDHLKSIFDKVGVNTRGGLVARLFFEHYAGGA